MSLVLTAEGETVLLRLATDRNYSASTTIQFHLYTNDYTPSRNTVLADLTEMSFTDTGYRSDTWYPEDWDTSSVLGNPTTKQFMWTELWNVLIPPLQAYGLFMTVGATVLLGAERFANAPFLIESSGDKISLPQTRFRIKDDGDVTPTGFEIPDTGEAEWLRRTVRQVLPQRYLYVEFFTNDLTLSDSTVWADFTICPDTDFRSMYDIASGGGGVVTSEEDHAALTLPETNPISSSFIGTLYGWVAREATSNFIYGAAKFPAPAVISAIGQGITVRPVLTLRGGAF